MSRSDPPDTDASPTEGDFLRRWARRKAQARTPASTHPEPPGSAAESAASSGTDAIDPGLRDAAAPEVLNPASAEQPLAEAPAPGPDPAERAARTDADMPPLDSLHQDSDYSAFLSPKVTPQLRQAALRQLFRQPKFNVETCLDDFQDDFRNFEALGDIVTADMRYMTKVKARREAERQRLAEGATPAEPPPERLAEDSAEDSAERPAEDPAEDPIAGAGASPASDTALPPMEEPRPAAENAPADSGPTDRTSASVPDRMRDAISDSRSGPREPEPNPPDALDATAPKAGIAPPDDEPKV